MKIGLISSAVPLIQGGGRFIVDWLAEKLRERGHAVEAIFIPSADEPATILQQMAAFRMIGLEAFERVVTFRPPAHVVSHPRKVVWFIHHIRVFYDLWDTEYRPVPDRPPGRALRAAIMQADTAALREAHRVFTNSAVVGDRLRRFNGIDSEVLYPPLLRPELFRCGPYGEEIVSVCRIEHHKRQHLLIEAMRHVHSGVRLRLCGLSASPPYLAALQAQIAAAGLGGRVVLEPRWITEAEKAALLATALASAYVPLDEDSYGYPTIEAAQAARCTITLADSGGTGEFVRHGLNGLVMAPDPVAIAEAFDTLHADRARAARLGRAAQARLAEMGIDWDGVIARLLS
jgi:glycosyltransferase involved in cell wall biosynthesis